MAELTIKDYQTTVTILEHLSDAVFILDAGGKIQYANTMALGLLHASLNDIKGLAIDDLLQLKEQAGNTTQNQERSLIECIYDELYHEIEAVLYHNQYRIPVVISFGFVKNGRRDVQYIIASAKDISVRKELEKELYHHRMLDLSQERYQEMGDLAVNLVHALSQPITALQLMIEKIHKNLSSEEPEIAEAVTELDKTLERIRYIASSINDVRQFAMKTADVSLQSLNIAEIVEACKKQLNYELTDRHIQLSVESDEALPPVIANPIRLQFVFNRLIKQLWRIFELFESPPEFEQRIVIHIRNVQNKWLQITMTDNTHLMQTDDPEEAIRLKPAKRSAFARQTDLAVVQMVITSMGGDLSEYSKDDGGRVFVMRLPSDQKEERAQLFNLIEMMRDKKM